MSKLLKSADTWSYFNGSTSYIQYADNDVFSFTDGVNDIPFEVEFDLYPTVASLAQNIFSKGAIAPNEYMIKLNSSLLYVRMWSAPAYIGVYVTATLKINTAYHVKVTYDGSKLWTGIKIYFNNVEQAVTNSSSGVYTGMVNTTQPVYVGAQDASTNFFNGYLRNLKIKKNNQLVFFAPLQDSTAVSKDVIGGLVHNAGTLPTVVNKLETERWAYFNKTSSQVFIGTTSTLGWMNSGVFNIQFDYKILDAGNYLCGSGGAVATYYGFVFVSDLNYLRVRWMNGSGVFAFNNLGANNAYGTPIKVTLQGNGTQIRYIQDNLITGLNVYDSGWVNCTYNTFDTTNTHLNFGGYIPSLVGTNCQLKNLKIYLDTAGTIPFLSLPFQNPDAIAVDTVGGLVGTNNNVVLINNMANILKS